jgi:hypothetical protein
MDFLKRNKTTILAGIGMLAALYVYLNYFSSSSAPLTTTTTDVSGDLLVTLNNLHTIKLDQTIFTDPVFLSFSDFGVTLPTQAAGRRNPFAPVGSLTVTATAPGYSAAIKLPTVPKTQ